MVDDLTHSSFYGCPCYLTEEDPLKNKGARVVIKDLPL